MEPVTKTLHPMPTYPTDGYLNTKEGWNLAAKYGLNSGKYKAAKTQWTAKEKQRRNKRC